MQVQTLKGFRDFLGPEAKRRQYVQNTLKKVFESYGFEPLETPTLEYEEILMGKYGEEGDKLMYRFEDNGNRRVAMRYDQTVPTARFVSQYQGQLPIPFKRYQMQNVWRAENTQKGRYREFMQCDADIIGVDTAIADAETIAVLVSSYKALGFENVVVLLNDRMTFEGLPTGAITAIDKLKKIGEDGVCDELVERGITASREEAYNLLRGVTEQKPTERLQKIMALLEKMDIKNVSFSPTLARGLDYYTGVIFEIESSDYPAGSLAGGGRYNELIGMFAGKQIPAVGFAIGFDRTLEAMEALDLFPSTLSTATAKVLVTIFSEVLLPKSLEVTSLLRESNINTEIYTGEVNKLDRQLKYANNRGIPYVVIIGPEEAEKDVVNLKNLTTGEQQTLPLAELTTKLLQ